MSALRDAVSHESTAQGASHDALVALNVATFTCSFGAAAMAHCDVVKLAELQITLSDARGNGQTAPVDVQANYAHTLGVCMGRLPPDAAAAQTPSFAASARPDCDALLREWSLHPPAFTSAADWSAYYTALLACPGLLAQFGGAVVAGTGAGGGPSGGGGGGGGGSGGAGGGGGGTVPAATASPPPTPEGVALGPYVVKQTHSLGGETISGQVCNLTRPFLVAAQTPKVAWNFAFVPADAARGAFTYAYSITSAGETHSASGTYTITSGGEGTLVLTMTGTDAVAFTGFSGKFPIVYSFNLVPTPVVGC
ncbi:MAG TPA: hypothetical protein VEU77_00575 [Candidatus Acidoferrales bacterium]|nr:hypothetical protein [Candidatus Acidoferrales bacterium]